MRKKCSTYSGPAHFVSGAGKNRADAVLGHADPMADFVIGLPFEMEEPNDLRFRSLQAAQEPSDFFLVAQTLLDRRLRINGFLRRETFVQNRGRLAPKQLSYHNAPCDHGQIGRQAALAAEIPQQGKIVLQNRQKYLGAEIVPIRHGNANASRLGRVVHEMDNQSHETIHEVFPCARPPLEATLKQCFVDFR
jgi:hypothetical protein